MAEQEVSVSEPLMRMLRNPGRIVTGPVQPLCSFPQSAWT